jgi:hypothetical protein
MIKLEDRSPCCIRHQMLMRRHVLPRQVVTLSEEQRYLEYWMKQEIEMNN